MAIVNDYAAIAAELRRLQVERGADPLRPPDQPNVRPILGSWHPMRATATGEALYRRLVAQRRRGNSAREHTCGGAGADRQPGKLPSFFRSDYKN